MNGKLRYGYLLAALVVIGGFVALICKALDQTGFMGVLTAGIGIATGTSFARSKNPNLLLIGFLLLGLSGCAAPQPEDFGGRLYTDATGRPLIKDCPLDPDDQTRLCVFGDRHDEWKHKIPEPKS